MHAYTFYIGQAHPASVADTLTTLGITVGTLDTVAGYREGEYDGTTVRATAALSGDREATVLAALLSHEYSQDCILVVRALVLGDIEHVAIHRPANRRYDDAYSITESGYAYTYEAITDDSERIPGQTWWARLTAKDGPALPL